MQLTYELTKEDFINFNFYHIENTSRAKKSLKMQRFVSPIIFLIAPFPVTMLSESPLSFWFTIFGAMYVLWVVLYPTYFKFSIRNKMQKLIDKGAGVEILGVNQIKLTDEGLESINERTQGISTCAWKDVDSMKEIDKYIFIYKDFMSAFIVPKRDLDEETKNEFIEKVEKYIQGSRQDENQEDL